MIVPLLRGIYSRSGDRVSNGMFFSIARSYVSLVNMCMVGRLRMVTVVDIECTCMQFIACTCKHACMHHALYSLEYLYGFS